MPEDRGLQPDGGWVRMSRACDDPEYFENLSDEIVEKSIQYSRTKDLEKARQILRRIHSRKLYKRSRNII